MRERTACLLCGRGFVPLGPGPPRYCARCTARASKESTRVLRVRCKECGRDFSTQSRAVKYCSDACRKRGRARASVLSDRARAPRQREGRPSKKEAIACRTCGGRFFPAQGYRGHPPSYCPDACRADGKRAKAREYARRYLADPERRAIHAARMRAYAARRREEDRGGGGGG